MEFPARGLGCSLAMVAGVYLGSENELAAGALSLPCQWMQKAYNRERHWEGGRRRYIGVN